MNQSEDEQQHHTSAGDIEKDKCPDTQRGGTKVQAWVASRLAEAPELSDDQVATIRQLMPDLGRRCAGTALSLPQPRRRGLG